MIMQLHFFHKWSKWSDPFDSAHDYKKLQARECSVCNKKQVKPMIQPWNEYFSLRAMTDNLKELK